MTFPEVPIGAAFDVRNGATPASGEPAYWDGKIPWIGPADLGKLKSRFVEHGARSITVDGYASCGTQLVPEGTIIISTRAPIGHMAISSQPMCFNQGCRGLIPRWMVRTDFGYWSLIARKSQLEAAGQGTTFVELGRDKLRAERIPLPESDTQKSIADFLDRETARIDRLIEKKQRLVELLGEKREAVITHAVTRGIEPHVPTRTSGLDWLGNVPSHWQVVPPIALFTVSKERAHANDQLLSSTQKYGVIPLAEFEELEKRQVTLAVANLELRKHAEIGDFVISMRSMDGGLERAHAAGSVRSSYSVLKPKDGVEGRYYGSLLKSSMYIQALRLTSNFVRDGQDMNFSHFRKVHLPKLDTHEQAAIADYIDTETSRIDALVTMTQRSIDLLREVRSALITAAVTGQIDVATWRKQGCVERHLDQVGEEIPA